MIRTHHVSLAAPLAVFSTFLSATAAQTVHVLDLQTPGLTKALQNTVNAAADGDIIVVKPGSWFYPPLTIDGKSLTVVADMGGSLQLSSVAVQNVPAGHRVVLRGLKAVANTDDLTPTVLVKDCAGTVWIEDSDLRVVRFSGGPTDTVRVVNSAAVFITRSTLAPNPTGGLATEGSGLVVTNSDVSLFGCICAGGQGMTGSGVPFPGTQGGTAVRVVSGSLFASGTGMIGGPGGVSPYIGGAGGPGGTALEVGGSALLRDCTLIPGVGGSAPLGTGGPPGVASVVLPGGSLTTSAVPARYFAADSPVRELQAASFSFAGVPGENAAILVSLDPAAGPPINFFDATLVVSLGAVIDAVGFGVIPPSGNLAATFQEAALPPSVQGVNVFLQSFFFDLSVPTLVLGPGSQQLLLDSSF